MPVLALDVSNNNPISLPQAQAARKQGVRVLIAKATEGTSFKDATFAGHRQVAKAADMVFGSFLFLHTTDTGDEAEYFLAYATPEAGELVVIDAEAGGQDGRPAAGLAKRADACAKVLEQNGCSPILYTSADLWQQLVATVPDLTRLRVWEAQYPGLFTRWLLWLPRLRMRLGHGATVVMWQWTDRFTIAGGRFDCSRVYADLEEL